MDKTAVGQVSKVQRGRSISIALGSGVKVSVCPHVAISRRGTPEGGSRCADCEVFVQLLNTGMCSAGEKKCSKPNFFPKLLFFQMVSGELPERICKRLRDAISFRIAQGFAQSVKLSSAFPFLPVFLKKNYISLLALLFDFNLLSGFSQASNPQQFSESGADEYQQHWWWGGCLDWSVLVSAGILNCLLASEAL